MIIYTPWYRAYPAYNFEIWLTNQKTEEKTRKNVNKKVELTAGIMAYANWFIALSIIW